MYSGELITANYFECSAVKGDFLVDIQVFDEKVLAVLFGIRVINLVTTNQRSLRYPAVCNSWFAHVNGIVFQVHVDINSILLIQ